MTRCFRSSAAQNTNQAKDCSFSLASDSLVWQRDRKIGAVEADAGVH